VEQKQLEKLIQGMTMKRKAVWYGGLLVVVVAACCIGFEWETSAALANDDESSSSSHPPLHCDLYIAESTIPNAGLGIFTGVGRKEGESVGNGDLCLPLIDIEVS
jgi:hypothetical protein